MAQIRRRAWLSVCLSGLVCAAVAAARRPETHDSPPRIGLTLHWDFINSPEDAERLLAFALDQGVEILNVVPPARIWEDSRSLAVLNRIFDRTQERGIAVLLNRIDGSGFSPDATARNNWLYTNILAAPGRLPSGRATPGVFLTTVGKPDYEAWMAEETAFYAERFSDRQNLLAFGVGLFNEPFVSQRGSLLCFDRHTNSYEIGQYTPYARDVYRHYVERLTAGSLAALNHRYHTRFTSFAEVPLPRDEHDPAFGDAALAYWDFAASINSWVVAQLDACHNLWKTKAHRPIPFMLQFNGALAEKLALGRPAFAALDVFDWMSHADILGLSLYTDCGYRDWGHASDRATVGFLGLAALLGKPTYVLESGSECHGAVLEPRELSFIARAVRPLVPRDVIYEFTKTSYAETFRTHAGKLMDNGWQVNRRALRAVQHTFAEVRRADGRMPGLLVFHPLREPPDEQTLVQRRALLRLALTRPLTFVTEAALDTLPAGSTLYLSRELLSGPLGTRLTERGVGLSPLDALLPSALPAIRH